MLQLDSLFTVLYQKHTSWLICKGSRIEPWESMESKEPFRQSKVGVHIGMSCTVLWIPSAVLTGYSSTVLGAQPNSAEVPFKIPGTDIHILTDLQLPLQKCFEGLCSYTDTCSLVPQYKTESHSKDGILLPEHRYLEPSWASLDILQLLW